MYDYLNNNYFNCGKLSQKRDPKGPFFYQLFIKTKYVNIYNILNSCMNTFFE